MSATNLFFFREGAHARARDPRNMVRGPSWARAGPRFFLLYGPSKIGCTRTDTRMRKVPTGRVHMHPFIRVLYAYGNAPDRWTPPSYAYCTRTYAYRRFYLAPSEGKKISGPTRARADPVGAQRKKFEPGSGPGPKIRGAVFPPKKYKATNRLIIGKYRSQNHNWNFKN